jgi:hypothetical protein
MSTTDQAFETLLKNLGTTIVRDLIYVLGGASILFAFLYRFNFLSQSSVDIFIKIFLVGLAWIIGYATQEIFCIFGLVTTAYKKPNKFLIFLLNRFAIPRDWSNMPVDGKGLLKARLCIEKHCSTQTFGRIERTINLKQLGSTMGPCLLITFIIILSKLLFIKDINNYDWPLAIMSIILSLIFILINRLKVAEQYYLEWEIYSACPECNNIGNSASNYKIVP